MSAAPGLHGRFLRLSGPNILANLLVPLASTIDVALLGRLATVEDLAGVALSIVLFDVFLWGFGFLRMATTGLTAQARGRGDADEERTLALRAVGLGLLAGVVILALRIPLREVGFLALQGSEATEVAARAYFDARILGAPFVLANYAWLGWLLGREQSGRTLLVSAVGHGANIGFNVWFIAGLGLGAQGAGYGTALSQVLMFVTAFALAAPGLAWSAVRPLLPRLRDTAALRSFFSLGRDITIRTLLLVGTFAVFTNVAATMGAVALAATAVLRQVVLLTAWFVDGFAFAVESLVGVFSGARDPASLRAVLWLAVAWGTAISAVIAVACVLLPGPLLGALVDHADVMTALEGMVGWLVPVLVLSAPAYALDGFFLGMTAGGTLRRAMVWSCLLGFAPWAAVAAWTQNVHWLWAALALFMLARTVTLGRHVPATLRALPAS